MEYLLIYLGIGLVLVLWDFRKTLKSVLLKIRFLKVDEYAATLAYGPKPKVEWWNTPGYVRNRDYLTAIFFIFFWPIKLIFFTLKLNGFVRNVRAGRIALFPKNKKLAKKFTLNEMKDYENIVNYLTFGAGKSDWIDIVAEERHLVIHNDSLTYDKNFEDLNCPTGEKYSVYEITKLNDAPEWEVEESHGSFNVRMTGHGCTVRYKETDGRFTQLEQIKSWIS